MMSTIILGISIYFCLLYIHINRFKFTYDKLKTEKFGFSISDIFNQVLLKWFTFLKNTSVVFLFPYYYNTNLTNKHPTIEFNS